MATPLRKTVRRKVRSPSAFGVNPEIVVSLYPGGVIGLREAGRRAKYEVTLSVGRLYLHAVKQRRENERLDKLKAAKAAAKAKGSKP